MNNEKQNQSTGNIGKVIIIIVGVVIVLWFLARILLSMMPTVGGSFGYGLPSGTGGRAIRDVEVDVDPQVVYRIDDHRFFTLEKYVDCTHGGFVYYNDTNKKIKKFAGIDGEDKRPQNEITIDEVNNAMSFLGKFIYAASDNIIAYPDRNVSYKYGTAVYFIVYENINTPSKNTAVEILSSSYETATVSDDAIYIQYSDDKYKKYHIPNVSDKYEWVDSSSVHLSSTSQDDRFHCDNNIKPHSVKYISN